MVDHGRDVLVHVKDQGTWVKELYLSLDEDEQKDVLLEIGRLSRVSATTATKQPQSSRRPFCRNMIAAAWGEERVGMIEEEHRALFEVIRNSAPIKNIFDDNIYKTMFNNAWDNLPTQPTLDHLRAFCGGLRQHHVHRTKQLATISEMLGLIAQRDAD
ncbi:hypothetical protein H257_00589 [Aphanomyces astaci]|uniref:Uncharacterized protein n=1 Tax=Aphanomyces astaci TaxID=112090 RepID=W4HDM1_APHAT|nr:hypothetical protein H257_00589 [Aphanomyces astaci]ETV89233.1 hypothetical protein H257_00589 [Aphanomyces astaci]|eukprot:XP_009821633.1 hypothetical protein H257_00589 [Aphanomyces astaci]